MTNPDRLTDEARAEKMIRVGGRIQSKDARALVSALAYIAHLEGALEAADEFLSKTDATCLCLGPGHVCGICNARDAYLAARASLPTSKEDGERQEEA